jgi:hypothetical protein
VTYPIENIRKPLTLLTVNYLKKNEIWISIPEISEIPMKNPHQKSHPISHIRIHTSGSPWRLPTTVCMLQALVFFKVDGYG